MKPTIQLPQEAGILSKEPIYYSVVIIKDEGIVSRVAGTCFKDAVERAQQRREDFPHAKEVRVVSPAGVHFSC